MISKSPKSVLVALGLRKCTNDHTIKWKITIFTIDGTHPNPESSEFQELIQIFMDSIEKTFQDSSSEDGEYKCFHFHTTVVISHTS